MSQDRVRVLSRVGSRRLTNFANDYSFTYAPYIQAAVREVGHSYRQVAKWLTGSASRLSATVLWPAQSVKNLACATGG
jgi:hypothetical protein